MFPIAHLKLAEKYLNKLSNEIKLGSIIPDFITLSPNISIDLSHKRINNFPHHDFELAWNLHIIADEISENEFFYPRIPDKLKHKFGEYVSHLFLEAALDLLLLKKGIFYEPPKFDNSILSDLEKYFDKNLAIIKSTMRFLISWEVDNYPEHLSYNLMYVCGYYHHTLTKSQVDLIVNDCIQLLSDSDELMNSLLMRIKEFD